MEADASTDIEFASHPYQREIVLELFSNPERVDLYKLHRLFRLSPGQVAFTVVALRQKGLVYVDGNFAVLTKKGRAWVLQNRADLFLQSNRFWAKSPAIRPNPLEPFEPYSPRLGAVDQDFFLRRRLS